MIKITRSESETELFGEKLASILKPGDCLALRGELGAGKTAFTRGLCRGLKCTTGVSSPTFNIVHLYPGKTEVAHVDLYRISDDLESIGWDDLFTSDRIVVIEWPEKAKNDLPATCKDVLFSVIDLNTREIKIDFWDDTGN